MLARNSTYAYAFLLAGFILASCGPNDKEQKLAEKEKELLQKENELLKKELEARKNSEAGGVVAASVKFKADRAEARKTFLRYLPTISEGRTLNKYWNDTNAQGTGYDIFIGDLNGDNLLDAVVRYSLEPTLDDNGGGGNAIGEFPGLIAMENTGLSFAIADHITDFGAFSRVKRISNGVIILEEVRHAEGDPRCCPSLKNTLRFGLRNNKLTELK